MSSTLLPMELRDHFGAIWRHRWIVLGASILAALIVIGVRSAADETYEARARLILIGDQAGIDAGRPENVMFVARTHAARAATPAVLSAAAAAEGGSLTPDQVDARTTVTLSAEDATLTVLATGSDSSSAVALADALAESLVEHIADREQRSRAEQLAPIDEQIEVAQRILESSPPGSAQREAAEQEYRALRRVRTEIEIAPLGGLEVLTPAEASDRPVSPRPGREGALAFLVTSVLAAEGAALWEYRKQHSKRQPSTTNPQ